MSFTFGYKPTIIPRLSPTSNELIHLQPISFESPLQSFVEKKSSPITRTTDPTTIGTSVLAIKGKDFVMMTADTCVSYGSLLKYRSIERIKSIGDFTLIGASGEYSDFQIVLDTLDELIIQDKLHEDGSILHPHEIHSYLTRVMYNRRTNMNPYYNQFILAGFRNGQSFLGQVDLVGTSFTDETLATGFGAHIARPLLRKAYHPDISREEAKKLLEECMRVCYYRDTKSINKIQLAVISAEGSNISAPYLLDSHWEHGNFEGVE